MTQQDSSLHSRGQTFTVLGIQANTMKYLLNMTYLLTMCYQASMDHTLTMRKAEEQYKSIQLQLSRGVRFLELDKKMYEISNLLELLWKSIHCYVPGT